LSMVKLPQRTV